MKKKAMRAGLGIAGLCLLAVSIWVAVTLANLPDVSVLAHYRPAAAAEVLDRNGNILTQFSGGQFRIWAPLATIPERVVEAVVIAEDDTFFDHRGINVRATWDAFLHDLRKKRFARGGSTITQQMIKNVLLTREKTLTRKLKEFVLAQRAEDVLTKRQILEIYLNEVEWGEDLFGIEAASRFYFDKHASELTTAEAALLAGMLPNPRYYNPFKRMDKAKDRQARVLFNMHQAKLLTDEEYRQASSAPLRLRPVAGARFDPSALSAGHGRPCYQRVLESVLFEVYGEGLYRSGLHIRTTLDRELQRQLDSWLNIDDGSGRGEEGTELPESVTAVHEGAEIRAIVCSSNEAGIWFRLEALGISREVFDTSVTLPESIPADEIVVTPDPALQRDVATGGR
jgi:membrane peptidoglycan carboxypeptidase